MKSCTIIISHFESVNFLHACIKQIRKHQNPSIKQKIFIADQSSKETYLGIERTYENDSDIDIIWMTKNLYSGYGIDYLMRYGHITTDYVAQIHADAFPISNNWLLLPITLIEECNYYFVGQLQFISKKSDTIYPNHTPFFAMAQCFNVARTETYREMSMYAGFTRFHNKRASKLTFYNDDWDRWAEEDYQNRGSDDDVVAFYWEDRHRQHDKLGLAVTGYIEPSFGRIIDGLVFHFGSANESKGVMSSMSDGYRKYTARINNGYTEELIEEMVSLAKANQPPQQEILRRNHWNGTLKISSPPSEAINKRIEELKNA